MFKFFSGLISYINYKNCIIISVRVYELIVFNVNIYIWKVMLNIYFMEKWWNCLRSFFGDLLVLLNKG